jgi:two-component system NarL family response regulator
MLTISDEEADLYDAIKAGAMGYLLKEISIEEVAAAIRAVHGGQSLISPSMASKLLTEFASMIKKTDDRQQVPTPRLTDREMELVGHDFYLYVDADTGLPSVVYRRHGYDYGVIRVKAS